MAARGVNHRLLGYEDRMIMSSNDRHPCSSRLRVPDRWERVMLVALMGSVAACTPVPGGDSSEGSGTDTTTGEPTGSESTTTGPGTPSSTGGDTTGGDTTGGDTTGGDTTGGDTTGGSTGEGESTETGEVLLCDATPIVLDHTVAPHVVEVPEGCGVAVVSAWGAGGGGGRLIAGGAGAYVHASLEVVPGEMLTFAVASGGFSEVIGNHGPRAGGGGGASIARRGEEPLLVAAGGGGGGTTGDSMTPGGGGGAGGAELGQAGGDDPTCNADDGPAGGGEGGTQVAGGAGGTAPSLGDGYPSVGAGEPGVAFGGGASDSNAGLAVGGLDHLGGTSAGSNGGGGAGGSGLFGGGGGGYQQTYCGGGGGGGSSFAVDPAATLEAGVDGTPGGLLDPDYVAGVGVGGPSGTPGSDGLVVVRFEEPLLPPPAIRSSLGWTRSER